MNLTLHIMVDGRVRTAAPYHPEDRRTTAQELAEQLPTLRQLGRVVVFVTDGNVAHLITGSRSAA